MPALPQSNSNPQQAGSGFTNLNRYLQANQSNQLGATVAGGVQQAGQQATGAINQAGQTFQQGAQAEKNRLGQVGQSVSNVLGGDVSKATDIDVNTFHNALNAQSMGPTGVSNASELRSKAQEAQGLGQATGTEAGRFGLLQRYVGRGQQYSGGQQRLDQMLLGQTGQQQLRGARANTVGLGQQAEQQIGAAQAQGQELQGQAKQLAETTKGQLGTAISGYDTGMQQKLDTQNAQYNNLLGQLGGSTAATKSAVQLDPKVLQQLSDLTGGVLGAGKTLYGADLSPYLSINSLYDTKQGIQSTDDLAKAQMLSKLSGTSLAGTAADTTLQGYAGHPELAGQFAANNPFQVSSLSDLNNAIQSQANLYNTGVNQANVHLKNISEHGNSGLALNDQETKNNITDAFLKTPQGQSFQQDPTSSAAQQAAMSWAQGGGTGNSIVRGQNVGISDLLNQLQQNAAGTAEQQQQLLNLQNQYNTFRVLQPTQPAVSANPVVGGPIA